MGGIVAVNSKRGALYGHDAVLLGYSSSALRAIRNFKVCYFATIPKGFQFWVNKIDEGCFEIFGMKS